MIYDCMFDTILHHMISLHIVVLYQAVKIVSHDTTCVFWEPVLHDTIAYCSYNQTMIDHYQVSLCLSNGAGTALKHSQLLSIF